MSNKIHYACDGVYYKDGNIYSLYQRKEIAKLEYHEEDGKTFHRILEVYPYIGSYQEAQNSVDKMNKREEENQDE
jgi:hypothetical protein